MACWYVDAAWYWDVENQRDRITVVCWMLQLKQVPAQWSQGEFWLLLRPRPYVWLVKEVSPLTSLTCKYCFEIVFTYQWNRKSSCFTSAAAPGSLHSQLWPGMRRIMKECICYSIHIWSSPCQSHRLSWTHSHSGLKDNISTQTSQKYRFFSSLNIPGCQGLPDTREAEKLLKCKSRME